MTKTGKLDSLDRAYGYGWTIQAALNAMFEAGTISEEEWTVRLIKNQARMCEHQRAGDELERSIHVEGEQYDWRTEN